MYHESRHQESIPAGKGWELVDVLSDGVLYQINKTLFHPRGYALSFMAGSRTMQLTGDGKEPWRFELGDELEQEKFDAFEALLKRTAILQTKGK